MIPQSLKDPLVIHGVLCGIAAGHAAATVAVVVYELWSLLRHLTLHIDLLLVVAFCVVAGFGWRYLAVNYREQHNLPRLLNREGSR